MFSDMALAATAGYATAGAVFAVSFLWRGVAALDSAAGRGSWGFRLLIAPGVTALWPLLLWKWWAAQRRKA